LGLTPVPNGQLATVVTSLEMRERPRARPLPESRLRLVDWKQPDPDKYRALFRRVGMPWLWFSRLAMAEAELVVRAGEVHSVVDENGEEVGIIELDFREPATCHIRFLGLVPELAGKGHGVWLFDRTLRLAWAPGVARVQVHTCTLDHPAALPAYLRAGFRAFGRAFESFPDPRLAGLLPRETAPQIPLVESGGD